MKTLVVYMASSFEKYPGVYETCGFETSEDNTLTVHNINPITGNAETIAVFRNWDYYTLESEPDD